MEVIIMDQDRSALLQMLDRGIDDMENNRELPAEEALRKVDLIREMRRYEKEKSAVH